ncbi:MAG: hypothetical protein MJZ34_02215 [Paludibacteraceae bacterium]|nr:hypothetical protein [Paludibacteraceae bacterium]
MKIKDIPGKGYFTAVSSDDVYYPGIIIEFHPESGDFETNPKLLFEYSPDFEQMIARCWTDGESEDYQQCVYFEQMIKGDA